MTIGAKKEQANVAEDREERGLLDQLEAAESDLDIDLDDQKYVKAAVVI